MNRVVTARRYFESVKTLHKYGAFSLSGAVSSTPNTKSLQPVCGTDDAIYKLARSNYYKYRATNLMFGFNSGIMNKLQSFCGFNALRWGAVTLVAPCRFAIGTGVVHRSLRWWPGNGAVRVSWA